MRTSRSSGKRNVTSKTKFQETMGYSSIKKAHKSQSAYCSRLKKQDALNSDMRSQPIWNQNAVLKSLESWQTQVKVFGKQILIHRQSMAYFFFFFLLKVIYFLLLFCNSSEISCPKKRVTPPILYVCI